MEKLARLSDAITADVILGKLVTFERPARDPRRAVVPHLLNADTLCIVKDAVALNQQATILHVFGELVNW